MREDDWSAEVISGLPLAPVGTTTVILKRRVVKPATNEAPPVYDETPLAAVSSQYTSDQALAQAIEAEDPQTSEKTDHRYITALQELTDGKDRHFRSCREVLMGQVKPAERLVDFYANVSANIVEHALADLRLAPSQ